MPFRLTRKAIEDLRSIARYTENTWGRDQRNAYLSKLDASFHTIAREPQIGLTCDDIGVISDDYDIVVPDCIAATDRAPMAVYRPTSDVHPVSIMETSDFIH